VRLHPSPQPLLQLSARADLVGRKSSLQVLDVRHEARIDTWDVRRSNSLIEQVAKDLHVHCGSRTDQQALVVLVSRKMDGLVIM
jgi:hypothetical protein